jgi:chromosome segregation ATPase
MIRDIIKKIKTYDDLVKKYEWMCDKKISLQIRLNNEIQRRKMKENLNLVELKKMKEKISTLEKRRRANAGAVGGLTAENNRLKRKINELETNLNKATNIINDLNDENRKLKNPVTMKQLLDYERTRKPQREVKRKIQK